jgi:hypothetical protein
MPPERTHYRLRSVALVGLAIAALYFAQYLAMSNTGIVVYQPGMSRSLLKMEVGTAGFMILRDGTFRDDGVGMKARKGCNECTQL